MPVNPIERFTISRVSDNDIKNLRNEIALHVESPRKASRTVPGSVDRRKFSLAQLTRYVLRILAYKFSPYFTEHEKFYNN